MIDRTLAPRLRAAASSFPVVALTGPRQSGKTTLVRAIFPAHEYVSLELPDVREFALADPRGFLARFRGPAILDEVQRTPDLFSYLQSLVDENDAAGQWILTGSQNFLLLSSISQSLAGRCAVLHLLPFSLAEVEGRDPVALAVLGSSVPELTSPRRTLEEVLHAGSYPRIHAKGVDAREWLASYQQTYVERDVRSLINVGDLETFGRFLRLVAGRTGSLLNLSSLAADTGVSHTTARRWISVLEASFIIQLLRPWHQNFGKRLIKAPKIYFIDTGLLAFLLGIREAQEIHHHAMRGAIFESFVVAEILKNFLHRGEPPSLYFWRDVAGTEIDGVIDLGSRVAAVEVKSGRTVSGEFFRPLHRWRTLRVNEESPAAVIYGGEEAYVREGIVLHPWFAL